MKVLLLTRYGRLGASSRMRFLQFLPWFEKAGFECTVAPLVDDAQLQVRYKKGGYQLFGLLQAYRRRVRTLMQRHHFDVVWIEKEALPWLPVWLERFLLRGAPYVLDYDDAIFHNYDQHSSALVRRFFDHRIDRLMAGARLVVAGNAYLAQRAQDAGAPWVEILPTVIDLDRYAAKPTLAPADEPLRIVWVGSPSTVRYLALLCEPLVVLGQRFAFKLRVVGGGSIDLPGVDVEFVQWTEATEVASIQACDIGVMPLFDSPWERGKCGYKLIQYMACGLPVVASPVGVNGEIVRVGENGFLADTASEWVDALGRLLSDAALRQHMGKVGRKRVEAEYCIQQVVLRLVALLSTAGEGR
ncbi:MAG: glycosyltransferase family 4 protein [Gammaproteobacteria bacterium]